VATVPGGTDVGRYDIRVTNSDGRHDGISNAYKVRFGFTRNLYVGSQGSDVLALEKRLRHDGYFPSGSTVNNFFSSGTSFAIIKYQKAKHLTVTGYLDSATRKYLNNH
jgi:peptidoglycan hydrolase-like protein with peptidoglycan-binding domain